MDAARISAIFSSLRSAADITKTLSNLGDQSAIQGKVIELQNAIISAQTSAMEAQEAQDQLNAKVKELEDKLAEYERWEEERAQYRLTQVAPGAHAYTPIEEKLEHEPPHWLCTSCFNKGKKGFLQFQAQVQRNAIFVCSDCGAKLSVPWNVKRGQESRDT